MSLIEKIRADQLAARKGQAFSFGDTLVDSGPVKLVIAPLLTTLLGEVGTVAKNAGRADATDEEVVATVKKFLKGVNENLALIAGVEGVTAWSTRDSLYIEKDMLEAYLPKQLTREQLVELLTELRRTTETTPKNKGEWMQILKKNYPGQYDGKLASEVF